MGASPFKCACGKITGTLSSVPQKGIHLVCYCDSCRAGAVYCGAALAKDEPVDLYLTQPANITIDTGAEYLTPFVFSPKGIIRWKASCCGVQMFSSQPDPKTAFMSVRSDRLDAPQVIGPVVSKAFVPKGNGKTKHEGIGALAKLIFGSIRARLSGAWRQTPLYNAETGKPIVEPILLSREEKAALLAAKG